MSDMMKRIQEAQAVVDGEQDNLIEAIATLAAAGHITVMPRDDNLINQPVILLPRRMYDRAVKLFGKDS